MHPVRVTSQALIRSFTEPRGKIYLLYGDPLVFRLSLLLASQSLAGGASLAVVDGCNRFDVHAITRFARERRLDPDTLLRRIFVSRGFTCYQMEAAVTDKLPAFLGHIHSRTAMIFGLLDTFYDEQAPLREAQHILTHVLDAIRRMKQQNVSLLLTCTEWNVLPKERNRLFSTLKTGMDNVYRLSVRADTSPQLFLEQHHTGVNDHGKNRTDLYEHHRQ